MVTDLKKLLNPSQCEAATHLEGPLLVLAGAGSGKTRVVTYRTAHLLENGVHPKNILLMTFTNKAAEEMKERLSKLVGAEKLKGMTVCTFHALCVRILHREIGHLGFKSKYSIFNQSDQRQVLYEVFRELKIDADDFNHDEILTKISLAKNKLIEPKAFPIKDDYGRLIQIIYTHFQEHLKQFNALDFDDLLYYTALLFREHPDILAKYQRKFHYIMVDEYQDTNHAQYFIADALAQPKQNIMVVGDDDQSIYSWRGADISNILEFEKNFPGAKTIKLEANYRSTAAILLSSNAVIRHNEDRKGKELKSMVGEGEKIKVMESGNPWAEAEKIAEEILLKRLKYNRSYREYAVLFRTNGQSKPFEGVFQRMKIPYQVSNQFDFYDRKEIKDALAYLKLINNPEDDLSFLRVVNYPRRGVGSGTISKIKERAAKQETSLFETCETMLRTDDSGDALSKDVGYFLEITRKYQQDINSIDMGEVFQEYLRNVGFMDAVTKEAADIQKTELKLNYISQLIENISEFAKKSKKPTLQNFLTKLALYFSSAGKDNEDDFTENSIYLMTIHAAKGLEFPYVYIAGFEEKCLPFQREEGDEIEVNEERRLCYVAMTRAKKELTLSYCQERKKNGQTYLSHPSRYLAEIPKQHLVFNQNEEKGSSETNQELGNLTFSKINSLFEKKDGA